MGVKLYKVSYPKDAMLAGGNCSIVVTEQTFDEFVPEIGRWSCDGEKYEAYFEKKKEAFKTAARILKLIADLA